MEWIFVFLLLIIGSSLVLAGRLIWSIPSGLILFLSWIIFHKNNFGTWIYQGAILGFTWSATLFLSYGLRKKHLQFLAKLDRQIQQIKEKTNTLHLSDSILQQETKILEQSLQEKEGLYESLKELNKTLEFSKTVEVFSRLVSDLTSYDDGWLIISMPSDKRNNEELYYHLFRHEPPIQKKGSPDHFLKDYEKELLLILQHSKSLFFIDNPYEDPRFAHKGVTPGTPSITAIRLIHEGSHLGTLILEGCKKRELESLEILSMQLSMEIKKTFLYDKVKNLSIIDGLTETYQRRHLLSLLGDEFNRLQKQGKSCTLLMADIDHFKGFNDHFGHLVGDLLLKNLSSCLQENLRPTDLVGRYGGEEFLLALPDTKAEEAVQIAERIRNDIQSRNFVVYDKLFKLTVSFGLAVFPDDSSDLKTLIDMADWALYQAKGGGRNMVKVYQKTDDRRQREDDRRQVSDDRRMKADDEGPAIDDRR